MGSKLLIPIIVIAAFLRLFWLAKSPPSLNWDEAALGYNAYSIWLTGRDEYGTRLPLSFRSFDDYKPLLYVYLTAPIVGIFGLTEFNTRLVSALCGILSVGLIYLVAGKLSKNKNIGLVAAILLAIEPWAIYYSRGAWEANLSLTIFLIAVWLFIEKKYGWAVIVAFINTFAYHSAKVYLLLTMGGSAIISPPKWKTIIGYGVISGLFVLSLWQGSGLARFGSTSIFKTSLESQSPYLFISGVGQRYLAYFNPTNLFVRGTNEPNQRIDGFGTFYAFEIIFWLIGWAVIIKKRSEYKLLWGWLILAPIPAILTWSWFNPVRVLPLLAAHTVLIALGAYETWKKLGWVNILVFGWATVNLCWYFLALLYYLPYKNYGDWQWGFRETAAAISPLLAKYDHVVWETGQAQPYIFTLFYLKYPPQKYQLEADRTSPRKNFNFGKFEFRPIYWPTDKTAKNTIFVGSVYSLPEELALKRIYDPQGYEMARIVVGD